MRVRRAVDRPIGASITPRGELERAPHERDVPALDRSASRSARTRLLVRERRSARPRAGRSCRGRAGGRCPGRSSSPTRRDLGEAREQAVHERAVGVAGARSARRGRPAWRPRSRRRRRSARRPRRRRRPRAARRRAGSSSSSITVPATSRWLFPTGRPSTTIASRASSACTSARLQPVSSATARSTRSPASVAGTTIGSLTIGRPLGRRCAATAG